MKKVKITVLKRAIHQDLIDKYEIPSDHSCDMTLGDVYYANGFVKPEGFCNSAWDSISPFVLTLSCGGESIFGNWMKDKKSALVSCNDGFRPVSFLLETTDIDTEDIC